LVGTPLGPRESWPPSLKLIVATILASQFPMAVRWGADFVLIYNDGYLPILGEKHPRALGLPFRDAWPEVEDQLGPLHAGLLAGSGKRSSPRTCRCASPPWADLERSGSRSATARSRTTRRRPGSAAC
jgi:hypothetical protein